MIVFGFLGTMLDNGGKGERRWQKWRPTISLCQQEDILIDRFELLIDSRHQQLAEEVKRDIQQVSPETEVHFHVMNLNNPWDFEEVYGSLHDLATGYEFDPEQQDYFMHLTTGTHVAQICMFLLTETGYFPAKILQSSPPKSKEDLIGAYTIIDLDLSRYDQIAQRFQKEQDEATSFLKSGIQTANPDFNHMIDQIEKVALKSPAPILLMGPTGAGKSHLARRIYQLKKRRHHMKGHFVEVNCATLTGDSAMSSLFGHKRGAYTGATTDRPGLLQAADQGVLFLDEIGELGMDEQAMLLRAIEDKRFLPLGSDRESHSDFQLLAGTNRNLAEEVRKGLFREDLFARINLWTYHLPGLKDRREDIAPNIQYELELYRQKYQQNISFNKEAWIRYLDFSLSEQAIWSANFRDLSASIYRMAVLSDRGRIRLQQVEEEIDRLRQGWRLLTPPTEQANQQILSKYLSADEIALIDLFDQYQLAGVLDICQQAPSQSAAGRTLFAKSRAKKKIANDADRLAKYLGRFDLHWKDLKS